MMSGRISLWRMAAGTDVGLLPKSLLAGGRSGGRWGAVVAVIGLCILVCVGIVDYCNDVEGK